MVILADFRIPQAAKLQLSTLGKVLWLQQQQAAYEAISSHPDIFFCPVGNQLIGAPNLTKEIKAGLHKFGIQYTEGYRPVGRNYPETARYNVVTTEKYLIGNVRFADERIMEAAGNRKIIPVHQGYTRCNLIPLKNDRFITSDKGIERTLRKHKLDVLFVAPNDILLPGFRHGFIGGTCGIWQNTLFFTGSLLHVHQGQKIKDFVQDMEIVELYDGPLFDGGSFIFL